MTRQEYIAVLTANLSDIPAEERIGAIEYYQAYIEDAGEENEAAVLKALGSPQRLAAEIKKETKNQTSQPDFGEAPRAPQPPAYTLGKTYRQIENKAPANNSNNFLFFLLVAIFTFPIWFSVLMTVMGVFIGVVCTLAFGGAGFIIAGVGVLFFGVALLVSNIIIALTTGVMAAALGFFGGVVCSGVAFLLMAIGLWWCCKLLPMFCGLIGKFFGWIGSQFRGRRFA